jgi:hypothetical protein
MPVSKDSFFFIESFCLTAQTTGNTNSLELLPGVTLRQQFAHISVFAFDLANNICR